MGSLQHGKRAVHPRMDVALHRYELWLVKLLGERRSPGWLRLIPFMVDLRKGVNVVRCLISVHDLKFLVDYHRNEVRQILATFLCDGDRLGRCGRLIRRAGRNVNNHILQGVPRTHNYRFRCDWSRMLLGTARLLRHINWLLSCRCALVSHFTADAAAARSAEGNGRGSEHGHPCGLA